MAMMLFWSSTNLLFSMENSRRPALRCLTQQNAMIAIPRMTSPPIEAKIAILAAAGSSRHLCARDLGGGLLISFAMSETPLDRVVSIDRIKT